MPSSLSSSTPGCPGVGYGQARQLTLLQMPWREEQPAAAILPARPPRSGMDIKGEVWLGSKPQLQLQACPPRLGGVRQGCRQVGPCHTAALGEESLINPRKQSLNGQPG